MTRLTVVPSDRHVERFVGGPSETLQTLEDRLRAALDPSSKVADPVTARLALGEVLERMTPAGSFLPAAFAGGVRAWQRTIDAVEEALSIVRKAGCAVAVDRAARGGGERARVLAGALAAHDEALGRLGLFEASALAHRLADVVRAAPPDRVAEAVGAREITAQLVTTWTPGELGLWRALDEALPRVGGRATIELPTFDVALDTSRTSSPLDRLCDDVAAALDGAPSTSPIDAPLGDFRFVDPPSAAVVGRVDLVHAADASAQARAVAQAVHEALAQGLAPERIAILLQEGTRDAEGPIRRALSEARVVVRATEAPAPLAAPIVRFALRALEIADQGFPRRDVANLLRSRYARALALRAHEGNARPALLRIAQALESTPLVRADDPVRAVELTVAGSSIVRRSPRAEERALPELARNAAQILRQAVTGATRADHAARALDVWSVLGLPSCATNAARDLLAGGGPKTAIEKAELEAIAYDARAWDTLVASRDGYMSGARALGVADKATSNETFRYELGHAMASTAGTASRGSESAVRLVRAREIAGEPLDLLVIVDFNEGVFPKHLTLPAFFSPGLEGRLRELDGRFPNPSSHATQSLTELAVAVAASDRLLLVHRARDEAGAMLAPSPIFAWLERGGAKARTHRGRPLRELTVTSDRGGALADSVTRRARMERARESFFSRDGTRPPTADVGALAPDELIHRILVEETGGGDSPLAVTSLERFAACPFQGYAAHVLHARPWRVNLDAPDPREQGSIVHGALAAAFGATAPLWAARPRDREKLRGLSLAAADAFLERGASVSGLRRLAIDEARRDVLRVVEWSLDDERWDFFAAEQPFGDGRPESWEAVRIERGGSTLALRGSIDRIDVGHGAARVRAVDYKLTERAASRATGALGELTFQLPIYARAAAERHGARESAGLYVPTRVTGPLSEHPAKGGDDAWQRAVRLEDGRPSYESAALDVIEEVRAGGLAPVVRDAHACDFCDFDGGCRKPRFAISSEREDEPG